MMMMMIIIAITLAAIQIGGSVTDQQVKARLQLL